MRENLLAQIACSCGIGQYSAGVSYIDSANLRIPYNEVLAEKHTGCGITCFPPLKASIIIKCRICSVALCSVPCRRYMISPTSPTYLYGDISPQDYFVVEEHLKLCLSRVKKEDK